MTPEQFQALADTFDRVADLHGVDAAAALLRQIEAAFHLGISEDDIWALSTTYEVPAA